MPPTIVDIYLIGLKPATGRADLLAAKPRVQIFLELQRHHTVVRKIDPNRGLSAMGKNPAVAAAEQIAIEIPDHFLTSLGNQIMEANAT